VHGKRVLEFAAGGAVSGIAAAIAGAAAQTNAALNDVTLAPAARISMADS
jgi:predicted nicotinamide N-methyase